MKKCSNIDCCHEAFSNDFCSDCATKINTSKLKKCANCNRYVSPYKRCSCGCGTCASSGCSNITVNRFCKNCSKIKCHCGSKKPKGLNSECVRCIKKELEELQK